MLLFKNGICVTDKISGKLECNAKKTRYESGEKVQTQLNLNLIISLKKGGF